MHSSRFTTWQELKDEVVNIRRTQLAYRSDEPMDNGALGAKRQGRGSKSTSKEECSCFFLKCVFLHLCVFLVLL